MQLPRKLREPSAVSCHGDFTKAHHFEPLHDFDDVLAEHRFAAGQFDRIDTETGKDAKDALYLVRRNQYRRSGLDAFHVTVDASEVTSRTRIE